MTNKIISEQPLKKNFDFIDSIRGIAMFGIVMEHSVFVGSYIFPRLSFNHIVYISLIQLTKFGTISFFILAGFLLGDKFKEYSPLAYFKRRVSNTFKPWLLWSVIFLILVLIKCWIITHHKPDFAVFSILRYSFKLVYLFSNYWFIINFLICIGVLLMLRRYLYSNILGLILFIFSLIYSVNIYFEWFVPLHTTAFLGFVFYLWLGAKFYQKWDLIEKLIRNIPYIIFGILFLITFCLSVYEITGLIALKSIDPYNTLRISNIAYSIVTVVLLLKFRHFNFVKYIKPRETTFGIYLIHYIFVFNVLPEIFRPLQIKSIIDMSLIEMLIFVMIRFVMTYGITFFLVKMLGKTKFKWVVGR